MRIIVTKPNPSWPDDFLVESERIRKALGYAVVAVHHIGSTAIREIFAKPVIDILLVVTDLQSLDQSELSMINLGYEAKGEFGIPRRRYFRRNSDAGVRTHQVHAFQLGSPHIERHLAFRDYMNSNPAAALAYSDLKQQLALAHPTDMSAYMDGKDAFVKQHEAIALKVVRTERGSL
ncbi:GrpB family protein [Ideonella sp.]|jgi:GrpB-like predicted nucleotidyltransferase (UPF0157 family)|uniref:GrpB family protein n=1 Tax=Ideonella sp. TaxID=1929293 RepID=UPI0037C06334